MAMAWRRRASLRQRGRRKTQGERHPPSRMTAYLERRHGHHLCDSNLEHLHHLTAEAPDPDQPMRPLLRVSPDEEQRSVVLGRPERE